MCAYRLTTVDGDTSTNDLQQPCHLQPADVMVVRAILHALAPTWCLDEHQAGENGSLMLMLTPPGPEDTTPTFVLSQTQEGVELAAALGDSCDTLHTAASVRQAVWMALRSHYRSTGLIRLSVPLPSKRGISLGPDIGSNRL